MNPPLLTESLSVSSYRLTRSFAPFSEWVTTRPNIILGHTVDEPTAQRCSWRPHTKQNGVQYRLASPQYLPLPRTPPTYIPVRSVNRPDELSFPIGSACTTRARAYTATPGARVPRPLLLCSARVRRPRARIRRAAHP